MTKINQLVRDIELWQARRHEQQGIVTHGQFASQDDFIAAQTYMQQIDEYLKNTLWPQVPLVTTVKKISSFALYRILRTTRFRTSQKCL